MERKLERHRTGQDLQVRGEQAHSYCATYRRSVGWQAQGISKCLGAGQVTPYMSFSYHRKKAVTLSFQDKREPDKSIKGGNEDAA